MVVVSRFVVRLQDSRMEVHLRYDDTTGAILGFTATNLTLRERFIRLRDQRGVHEMIVSPGAGQKAYSAPRGRFSLVWRIYKFVDEDGLSEGWG